MAEPWIRVHANLANKPIAHRASAALGVRRATAIGHLVLFWGNVSQHAANGAVAHYDDALLESWAMWEGKRGVFAKFLREHHFDAEGRVREWDDYAGALEHRRAVNRQHQQTYRERQRQQREELRGPDVSLTKPLRNNPTIRDDTRRDEVLTTTASTSRAKKPRSDVVKDNWVTELHVWWTANIGSVAPALLGAKIKPLLTRFTVDQVQAAAKLYFSPDEGPRFKSVPDFATNFAEWHRLASMPATDAQGQLTERGRRIMGAA